MKIVFLLVLSRDGSLRSNQGQPQKEPEKDGDVDAMFNKYSGSSASQAQAEAEEVSSPDSPSWWHFSSLIF